MHQALTVASAAAGLSKRLQLSANGAIPPLEQLPAECQMWRISPGSVSYANVAGVRHWCDHDLPRHRTAAQSESRLCCRPIARIGMPALAGQWVKMEARLAAYRQLFECQWKAWKYAPSRLESFEPSSGWNFNERHYHQMGGTCMAYSPVDGVVDAQLRWMALTTVWRAARYSTGNSNPTSH